MFDISPTEWTAILLSLRVAAVATLVATPLEKSFSNIAGIESAYATPNSGATFFSTAQSALLNGGTTGPIANQNNAT